MRNDPQTTSNAAINESAAVVGPAGRSVPVSGAWPPPPGADDSITVVVSDAVSLVGSASTSGLDTLTVSVWTPAAVLAGTV